CINAAERPNVKSLFEKLPGTATGVPLPCFLQTRCGDTDLHNILVPESIRKLQANCPSNLVDMAQLVDCSGATCYNVGAEQEAKLEKTVQTGQSPSQQYTSQPNQTHPYKSKKAIIIYIMVCTFIMLIIAGLVAAQQYKSSDTQL